MKKVFFALVVLSTLGMISCDDDSGDSQNSCQANASKCVTEGIVVCDKGKWSDPVACADRKVCQEDNGSAQCVGVECVYHSDASQNEAKCVTDSTQIAYCGSDFKWQAPVACGNDKQCDDSGAVAVCKAIECTYVSGDANEKRCANNNTAVQACQKNGQWGEAEACPNNSVCNGETVVCEGKPIPDKCDKEHTFCSANQLVRCSGPGTTPTVVNCENDPDGLGVSECFSYKDDTENIEQAFCINPERKCNYETDSREVKCSGSVMKYCRGNNQNAYMYLYDCGVHRLTCKPGVNGGCQ